MEGELVDGLSFRGELVGKLGWKYPAKIEMRLNRDVVYLIRSNIWGRIIRQIIPLNGLHVKTRELNVKLKREGGRYCFRVRTSAMANMLENMLRFLVKHHFGEGEKEDKEETGEKGEKGEMGEKMEKGEGCNIKECNICCYNRSEFIRLYPCNHKICRYCFLMWNRQCPFCRRPVRLVQRGEEQLKTPDEFLGLLKV